MAEKEEEGERVRMKGNQQEPTSSNETKKTRDQLNLTECHSCGLRIPSENRLEILYSEWRIILLCTKCINLVESSQICSYCFKQSSDKCPRCCLCKRAVHKSCFSKRKTVAPWSYSCSHDDSGFSVCIDCWVPKSVGIKKNEEVCRVRKGNDLRVSSKLLEDVVGDANCAVQDKIEAAARARELAVMKALEARKEAELARKAPDLVANNVTDDFESFWLHRGINSSPQISNGLCLVNSSCLPAPTKEEGNGEALIRRNSNLTNPVVCRNLDMEHWKSSGEDDCRNRTDAKTDGNVDMQQLMEGEESRANKMTELRENNHSVNPDSQSCRGRRLCTEPENERCKRKHDPYMWKYSRRRVLLKYSRRKFEERLNQDGRPELLHQGLYSRLILRQQNCSQDILKNHS